MNVSESTDLVNWRSLGVCCTLPKLMADDPRLGRTTAQMGAHELNVSESTTVMRHPQNGRWILMANWQWVCSDDPEKFPGERAQVYDYSCCGRMVDLGFACETVAHDGRWYRSGTLGPHDFWKLGFTEIEWVKDAAFRIVKPSVMSQRSR